MDANFANHKNVKLDGQTGQTIVQVSVQIHIHWPYEIPQSLKF